MKDGEEVINDIFMSASHPIFRMIVVRELDRLFEKFEKWCYNTDEYIGSMRASLASILDDITDMLRGSENKPIVELLQYLGIDAEDAIEFLENTVRKVCGRVNYLKNIYNRRKPTDRSLVEPLAVA